MLEYIYIHILKGFLISPNITSERFFGGSNIFTPRTLLNFQAEKKIEWVRGDGKSYQPDLLFHFTRYSMFDIREKAGQ